MILGLVVLHIAAIAFYRIKKGDNLVRPMLLGDKLTTATMPNARDDLVSRLLALLVLGLCALAVFALLTWTA